MTWWSPRPPTSASRPRRSGALHRPALPGAGRAALRRALLVADPRAAPRPRHARHHGVGRAARLLEPRRVLRQLPQPAAPHSPGTAPAAPGGRPLPPLGGSARPPGPYPAPVADLRAVLPHPDGADPLAAVPPASRARDHDLRGTQRGHPGGADGDPGSLSLLRAEGVVAAGGALVERGGDPDPAQRRGPRPALHAVPSPRLRHGPAGDLHRLLALHSPARLPRAAGVDPPRGLTHPAHTSPRLVEERAPGRTANEQG